MKTLRSTDLKIILKPINDIITYQNNPRMHSRDQISAIKKSVEILGNRKPIEIDENNVIIAGHGRLEAYKELEMKEVPVIIHSDMTEDEKKAYRIADNEIALKSNWDFELLALEIESIGDIGLDFDMLNEKDNPIEEWKSMPEYQNNVIEKNSIIIHFENDNDKNDFAELLGQKITDDTKYLWFPKKEKENIKNMGYMENE